MSTTTPVVPHLVEASESGRTQAGIKKPNWWSRLNLSYYSTALSDGYANKLEESSIPPLQPCDESSVLMSKFDECWSQEVLEKKEDANLSAVLKRIYKKPFMMALPYYLIMAIVPFVSPYAIEALIKYIQEGDDRVWYGLTVAGALVVQQLLGAYTRAHGYRLMVRVGASVQSSIIGAVFRKATRLSNKAQQNKNAGELLNLITHDAMMIFNLIPSINFLWICPVQIIGALALLWLTIGWLATLSGFLVMLISFPINGFIMSRFKPVMTEKLKVTDKRMRFMNDLLRAIRTIKVFAWETFFLNKVADLRHLELKQLRKFFVVMAELGTSISFVPVAYMMVAFTVYATQEDLTSATVFKAIALFEIARVPLFAVIMILAHYAGSKVSFERLQDFLLLEERATYAKPISECPDAADCAIVISNASFRWESNPELKAKNQEAAVMSGGGMHSGASMAGTKRPKKKTKKGKSEAQLEEAKPEEMLPITLNDINMRIRRNKLTMVIGPVGSGKSSVVSALLGEISRTSGDVYLTGSIGYVEQTPWLMNGTVRSNILMGMCLVQHKLNNVIKMCALEQDLAMLPAGLDTEVGERGITLSGGQKLRLSLARAIYQDRDIYVMDDPLSAVDAHVSKHLFFNCIKDASMATKTIVLVTNALNYLSYADDVYVLENGRIVEHGDYDTLYESNGVMFRLVKEFTNPEDKKADDITSTGHVPQVEESVSRDVSRSRTRERSVSRAKSTPKTPADDGKLYEEEERGSGRIPWKVYRKFFQNFGGCGYYVLLVAVCLVGVAITVLSQSWIAIWTSAAEGDEYFVEDKSDSFYVTVWGAALAATLVIWLVRELVLIKGLARTVEHLHKEVLESVVRSPQSFFDVTPQGRITNRFSRDLFMVDVDLPNLLMQYLRMVLAVLGSLVVVTWVVYYLPIVFIPMIFLFEMLTRYYRVTARELQRMESISRSAVAHTFTEAVTGVATIRAFGATQLWYTRANKVVDTNHRFNYTLRMLSEWLNIRISMMSAVLIFVASSFVILTRDSVNSSLAGLAITTIISTAGALSYMVTCMSEFDIRMTAVERLQTYGSLPPEPEVAGTLAVEPASSWPEAGCVSFANVSMRYRPNLPLVLNNVSFDIKGGEKVGVVGRTGSGKSSLLVALFRLVNIHEGEIAIDGVNTAQVRLPTLRSSMFMVPQDPVMFEGTVRENLDPFDHVYLANGKDRTKADEKIWNILEQVHMKGSIANMSEKLDTLIRDNGSDFSVGERQLLSLARAIIQDVKIVCLDEATASVDLETDTLIQHTLRQTFAGRTVITIAHRLNTIIDSDKVIVMNDAQVAECDTPRTLVQKQGSMLNALIDETGAQNAAFLRKIALAELTVEQAIQAGMSD